MEYMTSINIKKVSYILAYGQYLIKEMIITKLKDD